MRIERITLTNFRCFGPEPISIDLGPKVTAFIGVNGSGKTAVFQALSRLFGITSEQRRVRRQDFHVPRDEDSVPGERTFSVEVVLDFPELRSTDEGADTTAIPEFFQQMAIDDQGNLKCRLRFDARWIDDGSIDGAIEPQFRAIRTLAPEFDDAECSNVTTADRTKIQLVYVPSVRDGESQVEAFLRGRLWRAISWSEEFREAVKQGGDELNEAFGEQPGVDTVVDAVRLRWKRLAGAEVQGSPDFHPLDQRFDQFVRRVAVHFAPGETGRPVELGELSDGQRSLFHIGMTLAAVDVEDRIRKGNAEGFSDQVGLPALTLIALEEPENNLSPFFLSRILSQIQEVASESSHVQALVSSHSASLVGRVPPDDIRHFRLATPPRTSLVQRIALPPAPEEAGKFVREAVRSYPELYFARFVVLGEGASEEIVIPRVADASGIQIDKSFVAVVPLGGRHVQHFWKLLRDLGIPHATLLDLDAGRAGGGWGRIKAACTQLLANGVDPEELFGDELENRDVASTLASFDGRTLDTTIGEWTIRLRRFGVFFSAPLDLDMMMLESFPEAYQSLPEGLRGPRIGEGTLDDAEAAVLGAERESAPYTDTTKPLFPWYRYLFLGRGKPDTHLRVLSGLDDGVIRESTPEVFRALLDHMRAELDMLDDTGLFDAEKVTVEPADG